MDADVSNAGRGRVAAHRELHRADSHAAESGAGHGARRRYRENGWRRPGRCGALRAEIPLRREARRARAFAARTEAGGARGVGRPDDSGDSGAQGTDRRDAARAAGTFPAPAAIVNRGNACSIKTY